MEIEKWLERERWGCGRLGHGDKKRKSFESWNQDQTLTDCLCCHMSCAQHGTPWHQSLGPSRAVSNREFIVPLPSSLTIHTASPICWSCGGSLWGASLFGSSICNAAPALAGWLHTSRTLALVRLLLLTPLSRAEALVTKFSLSPSFRKQWYLACGCGDSVWMCVWQRCEGMRPDVQHLDQSMMTYEWFKKKQVPSSPLASLPLQLSFRTSVGVPSRVASCCCCCVLPPRLRVHHAPAFMLRVGCATSTGVSLQGQTTASQSREESGERREESEERGLKGPPPLIHTGTPLQAHQIPKQDLQSVQGRRLLHEDVSRDECPQPKTAHFPVRRVVS